MSDHLHEIVAIDGALYQVGLNGAVCVLFGGKWIPSCKKKTEIINAVEARENKDDSI